MKRLFAFLALTGVFFSLCACASASYSDLVPTDRLGAELLETLDADGDYLTAEQDALADYFTLPDFVTDHTVYFRSDRNNLDEFGIFHAEDGRVGEMATLLSDYLDRSFADNRAWYDSYIPTETPKLRDAEVRTYGNYAVYAILSREDRARLFDALESALKIESQ